VILLRGALSKGKFILMTRLMDLDKLGLKFKKVGQNPSKTAKNGGKMA